MNRRNIIITALAAIASFLLPTVTVAGPRKYEWHPYGCIYEGKEDTDMEDLEVLARERMQLMYEHLEAVEIRNILTVYLPPNGYDLRKFHVLKFDLKVPADRVITSPQYPCPV